MLLDRLASSLPERAVASNDATGVSRRTFLTASAAAGGGLLLSIGLPRAILPAEAVQRVGDGAEVYVVDAPNRFRRLPVTDPVLLADGRVAVLGLSPGMVVVGKGAFVVRSSLDAEAPE